MVEPHRVGQRNRRRNLPVPHRAAGINLVPDLARQHGIRCRRIVPIVQPNPDGVIGTQLHQVARLHHIDRVADVLPLAGTVVDIQQFISVDAQVHQPKPGVSRNPAPKPVRPLEIGPVIWGRRRLPDPRINRRTRKRHLHVRRRLHPSIHTDRSSCGRIPERQVPSRHVIGLILLRPEPVRRQPHPAHIGDPPGPHRRERRIPLRPRPHRRRVHTLLRRVIGDDVDDAGNRIEPKQRRIRPLDDLDLPDLLQRHRQRVPLRPPQVVQINLLPLQQHQQPRIARLIIAANPHVRRREPIPPHVDPSHELQHIGKIIRPRTANIVRRDDLHVRRHFRHPLRLPGRRHCDGLAEQLLEAAVIHRLSAHRPRERHPAHKRRN